MAFCGNCGTELGQAAQYCATCGGASRLGGSDGPTKRTRRLGLRIATGMVTVLVVALATFLFTRNRPSSQLVSATGASSPTSTASESTVATVTTITTVTTPTPPRPATSAVTPPPSRATPPGPPSPARSSRPGSA